MKRTYTTLSGSYYGMKYIHNMSSFILEFDFELATLEGLKKQDQPDFDPDTDLEEIEGSLLFLLDTNNNMKVSWDLPNDVSNREKLEEKIFSLLDVKKRVGYASFFIEESTILNLIGDMGENGATIHEENLEVKDYGYMKNYIIYFKVNNDIHLNFKALISKNSKKALSVFVEDPDVSMLEWTKIEGLFNEEALLSFFTNDSKYAHEVRAFINS